MHVSYYCLCFVNCTDQGLGRTTRQQPGQATADKQRGKKKGKRIKMWIPIWLFLRKYLWREVMGGSTENHGGTKWSNRKRAWNVDSNVKLIEHLQIESSFLVYDEKKVKTSQKVRMSEKHCKMYKKLQIHKWMWYGQYMDIRVDKVEILQLQQMGVFFSAKVEKCYKVSYFHKMTKKKAECS